LIQDINAFSHDLPETEKNSNGFAASSFEILYQNVTIRLE